MNIRLIELFWCEGSEMFETNADNQQIERVIKNLQKNNEEYCTDDFVDEMRKLKFHIKRIDISPCGSFEF